MKVVDLKSEEFVAVTSINEDIEVSTMFVGDLLSHVLGKATEGTVLITVLTNINTLAVASLLNFSAIIFVDGIQVPAALIKKAEEEGIALFKTEQSAKDTVISLYKKGLE